jgi:hypothetical protein
VRLGVLVVTRDVLGKERLTSSALLVELLLANRPGLDDETVAAFSSALALVIPFVAQECLPCPDHFCLVPVSLNSLLDADVDAQRFESIVSAVDSSQVATRADVVEVESVRPCQICVDWRPTGLESSVSRRGQRGGVHNMCDGDLQQKPSRGRNRCQGGEDRN